MKLLIYVILFLFSIGGSTEVNHYTYYIAEGPSMTPSILPNNKLIVDTEFYKDHPYERGDIIVFMAPNDNIYVKRVVGLPGETITMKDNELYINQQAQSEPYIEATVNIANERGEKYNMDFDLVSIPDNTVFVLGDNRRNSYDSMIMGSLHIEKVIGKVIEIQHD